jgi:hypothetical protein
MPTPPTEPAFSADELERLRRFAGLLEGDIVLTATQLVFAWLLQQLDGEPLPTTVLAQLAAAVRAPLAEFLNAHPEVAEALRPAWERIEERWREAVRRDALSRARPHLVRRERPPEE